MEKILARVLVVDDNDLMRALLRGILRGENCEVVGEAKNGHAAVSLTELLKPQVVFLDVMMPEMDGLAALTAIKEAHPEVKVIMVTGDASPHNVHESISHGASGFIVKPFNAGKVMDTLRHALKLPAPPAHPAGAT